MNTYIAKIDVMPLDELLDPQGKAVMMGLENMGVKGAGDVRIGKHIKMMIEAENEFDANQIAEEACKKLLHNPVIEQYSFVVEKSN